MQESELVIQPSYIVICPLALNIRPEMLLALLSSRSEPGAPSSLVIRSEDVTAAASTDAFLASKLKFYKDKNGQEICLVKAGDDDIGVMMGWEQEIMQETVKSLCGGHECAGSLKILNIGFGLGIVSTIYSHHWQSSQPFCIFRSTHYSKNFRLDLLPTSSSSHIRMSSSE